MEILFKDSEKYYYIKNGKLNINNIGYYFDVNLVNIKHLKDAEVLYHYYDPDGDIYYPVYYEHTTKDYKQFITRYDDYCNWLYVLSHYIKDYTLVNLKLLDNGDII